MTLYEQCNWLAKQAQAHANVARATKNPTRQLHAQYYATEAFRLRIALVNSIARFYTPERKLDETESPT